jgi:hypothetical protein
MIVRIFVCAFFTACFLNGRNLHAQTFTDEIVNLRECVDVEESPVPCPDVSSSSCAGTNATCSGNAVVIGPISLVCQIPNDSNRVNETTKFFGPEVTMSTPKANPNGFETKNGGNAIVCNTRVPCYCKTLLDGVTKECTKKSYGTRVILENYDADITKLCNIF